MVASYMFSGVICSRNHSNWFWQICPCCTLSSTDCLEVAAPSTIEKLDVSKCFNVDTVAGVSWAQLYSELVYSIVLNVVNECLISRITLSYNENEKDFLPSAQKNFYKNIYEPDGRKYILLAQENRYNAHQVIMPYTLPN